MSQNLRRLCQNEPSISHVCRAIGVTRQQFNGYLAAKHFPNDPILSRICEYFNVDEIALVAPFIPDREIGAHPANGPLSLINHQDLVKRNATRVNLDDGLYDVYFSVPGEPGKVIRSLMVLKTVEELRTFRRITSYYSRKSSNWSYYRGDHRGVALQAGGTIYLCSFNQVGVGEPSLVSLSWTQSSQPLLAGVAVISGLNGPATVAVVVKKNEQNGLLSAVRQVGTFGPSSREVPKMVIHLLKEELKIIQTQANFH
ncbi:helix-turn-helix domain-containing protein [Oricola cellulosilytica]|uniref:XRE family transcriptional regulator n=1 Tax=Oricola cellulosilytica TaxID=1429082 RepID=A0A4R0P8W2_9HYPH|nr:helix-turn-helix transcriptional regulator [Oricola cellulosilytica]TCD13504.1 XRE family transcriptional regulator [Oricola cellulosilytica]